ncbi:MAG: lysophospholipid acyltransferase family protein [Chlorobiales bacterium]|nr:lysophospholipid acyltransferase family protein [Chlorobiales bacterium]
MLTVRRSRVYTRWFSWYSRRQFKRHFHAVRVSIPPETLDMQLRYPVIFYCNHAYWWDGFWSQLCTEEFFRQNLYIIIEYQQLVRHRFFTRLGAFSIDRSRPRSAVGTLEYAAQRLMEKSCKQNALWVFPQGMIEHVDKQQLRFYNGTSSIVSRVLRESKGIYLVSVVSRIEYLDDQRPDLFLSFNVPEFVEEAGYTGQKTLTKHMQDKTVDHLSVLKEKIIARDTNDFRLLIKGAESINKKIERFRRLVGLSRVSP